MGKRSRGVPPERRREKISSSASSAVAAVERQLTASAEVVEAAAPSSAPGRFAVIGLAQRHAMALALLALLAFHAYTSLIWLAIDHRPPRADESHYLTISEYSFRQLKAGHPIAALNLKSVTVTKPGMVEFLSALTYFVIGHDEHTAIFLVNLSSNLLTAFALMWLGRMLYGTILPGLVAALWMQILPGVIVWSGYYQIDLALTAACTLTLALCVQSVQSGFRNRLAALALLPTIAIGIAIKHLYVVFAGPPVAILVIAALSSGERDILQRLKKRWLTLACILVGTAFGIAYQILNIHIVLEQVRRAFFPPDQGPKPNLSLYDLLTQVLAGSVWPYVAFFVAGCIVSYYVSRRYMIYVLSVIVGGCIGVSITTQQPGSYYLFPLLPSLGLVCASVFVYYRLSPKPKKRDLRLICGAIALCVAIFFAGVHVRRHLGTANPVRLIAAAYLLDEPASAVTTNPLTSVDYWRGGLVDGNASLLPYPNDWKLDEIVASIRNIVARRGKPAKVGLLSRWPWMSDYNLGYKLYKEHLEETAVLGGGTPLQDIRTRDDVFSLGDILVLKYPVPFSVVDRWPAWVPAAEKAYKELMADNGRLMRERGYDMVKSFPLPDDTLAYVWYRPPNPDYLLDSTSSLRIAPSRNGIGFLRMECDHQARSVLFEHPVPPPGAVTVDWPVHLRPGARLQFGIGMSQLVWDPAAGDGVDFNVYLDRNGQSERVFSKYIDPKNNPCDRRWFDYDVPLNITREQDAHLRFMTGAGPRGDITSDHAGWSEPHVVY